MSENDYKTFTSRVNTATLLDKFVPTEIGNIAQRFKPIKELQERYINRANYYAQIFKQYEILTKASTVFTTSVAHMNYVFTDFQSRMQYFTLVIFGKVSTGKTSFICDITQCSPQKLTELISQKEGFNPQADRFSVGPNVETCHLYEILIDKSCIRLVDVPGIGGVVHDTNSLAPFVDMADCVVFLLDANSDIGKDDYDFLYEHVASLGATTSKSGSKASFTAERGMDKKILVVINKWNTTYQNRPPQHAEKDWERKRKWILEGDEKKGFSGISGLFTKAPQVVKANTLIRDDDTGEPYEEVKHLFYMEEVVKALEEILKDEGAELRLNRPRQVLSRELINVCEQLENLKVAQSLEALTKELEEIGIRIDSKTIDLEAGFDARLNHIQNTFNQLLAPQIKLAIRDWKPSVSFWEQGKVFLNKQAGQEKIKERWEVEIRSLLREKVKFDNVERFIESEAHALSSMVAAKFRIEFSKANPRLRDKIAEMISGKSSNKSLDANSADDLIKSGLENAVRCVENEILNDIINLVTTDAILAVLLGVILNPIGSILLIIGRRLWRDKKKKEEIKNEIDEAINVAVNDAALEVRRKLAERLRSGIDEISQKFREVLKQEEHEITEPKRLIDSAIANMQDLASQLNSLQVTEEI